MKKQLLSAALILGLVLAGCSSAENSTDENSEVPKEEVKKNSKAGIGETVTTDGAKITINSAESLDQLDDMYSTPDRLEEGKKYELIDITIENLTDEEMKISSMMCFTLKDGDGREQDYELPVGADGQMDGEILPGEKMSGQLTYMANAEGELILNVKINPIGGETVQFQIR